MFSINVDKIVSMSEKERQSFTELANSILNQQTRVDVLGVVEGYVNAFKLAYTFMSMDMRVLFVDANLSNEIFLGKYRLGKNIKGLMEFISTRNWSTRSQFVCVTNEPNLDVIFTGAIKSVSTEGQDFVTQILNRFGAEYDFIVLDGDKDGLFGRCCDTNIVFVDEKDYDEQKMQNLIDKLEKRKCNITGVVINE